MVLMMSFKFCFQMLSTYITYFFVSRYRKRESKIVNTEKMKHRLYFRVLYFYYNSILFMHILVITDLYKAPQLSFQYSMKILVDRWDTSTFFFLQSIIFLALNF